MFPYNWCHYENNFTVIKNITTMLDINIGMTLITSCWSFSLLLIWILRRKLSIMIMNSTVVKVSNTNTTGMRIGYCLYLYFV